MIILHACPFEDQFFLWGEITIEGDPIPVRRRGRKPKVPKPKPYPFDAGFDELALALKDAAVGFKPNEKRSQSVTIWMPTRGDFPMPSSPLIAELPQSQAKIGLAPWNLTAYPLSIEEAVTFLCGCMGKRTLASGVVVGADLTYWADALRSAGSLVARQQVLPGLRAQEDGYRALWEPVFAGEEARRLAELAKRMPAVARALSGPDTSTPPETPAVSVLQSFVTASVDHLVRSASLVQLSPRQPLTKSGRGRRKAKPAFESVHEAWLYALRSPDGGMEWDESELAQLAAHIQEWRRPIAVSARSPFRLCFRLEEPEKSAPAKKKRTKSSEAAWNVRYLLQPHDDPSLLIPVGDAWKMRGTKAAALKQHGTHIREYLLSSLGQAAGLCPRIAASLEAAEPAGYAVDTLGAYEFLREKAMALEQAGFGVMLPAWWTRKGTKAQLAVRANIKGPKMQGGSGMSLESLVQFDWELALGGRKLSVRELEALAKLKLPLVRLRGQWVEINVEEIQAAINFWKKQGSGTGTVRDIVQMALGAKEGPGGFAFGGVKATGWIGKLIKQLEGRIAFEELDSPKAFSGTLRPYQLRGYSWLSFLRQWGLGACLADDMGLGKTIETLAMIQRDWETQDRRPVLLVCPTSVVNNWQKEASRFTPELPVLVHHGLGRTKGAEFTKTAQQHAIVISSYGLLHRDIQFLKDVPWAGVVLDEAQNIKNPETKQAKTARSIEAEYRIALTGTPVENNVGDLWSIMEFLNPGLLGTQAAFKRNFFVPIQAQRDVEAADRLKRITGPFVLRRLKTDASIISDLPEKMEMKVFCSLTKEQASLYKAVLKNMENALKSPDEGIQRKGVILGVLSKLKQVCNHPAQFLGDRSAIPGRSGKLARLTEMLEEILEVGDRTLIFSQFAEMGEMLKRHLQETFGREVLFLYGGVPRKQRDRMIGRFQAEGGPPIFVLSLKAGGTGLNLTRANHVFHFDRWWNPAVENQATDRAFRIGQTKNVEVHKFVCAGTLEERIDEMIERKKAVAEQVVGTGEGWLTELSNEELKDIFALRKEAVGD